MTIYRDPRLADPLVLALAGKRLLHRQAQPPLPTWQEVEGLAALLDYAKRLPAVDPWDLPGVYEGAPGFGGLLWQARQMQEGAA
jgi:hypothetical protein